MTKKEDEAHPMAVSKKEDETPYTTMTKKEKKAVAWP